MAEEPHMKVVFMGTPSAAVPCLKRLVDDGHEVLAVYCQPDRPSGRGQKLTAPPVKIAAQELALEVRQPEKIKTPEAAREFRSLGADLAVVVAYGRILPTEFLTAFPNGAINIHFSLLPKYRGAAPVNWAIINGETETGVCSMRMDAGLDTGDLLLARRIAIESDENSVGLMQRLSWVGADVLSETLERLDTIVPKRQDDSAATYAPMMSKSDGLIDWSAEAEVIRNRVRGFQPFPTSYSFSGGKKITFWNSEICNDKGRDVEPGTVVEASGDSLVIACGGGSRLRVTEIQIEGKKRMPVRDFLNGKHFVAGDVLGGNPS